MSATKTIGFAFLLVLIILGVSSFFVVNEGRAALILRLGKIETNVKTGLPNVFLPGLHFKVPFIEHVRKFDMRLQTLSGKSSRVLTLEQKDLIVDYFTKWRVSDLPLFLKRTNGDYFNAEKLLAQQVGDSLRAEFGERTVKEVVSDDREKLMSELNTQVNKSAKSLGIDVVDVRIKRIDLPGEVSNAVYSRMRTKREGTATQLRADGKAQGEKIRAQADAKATVIVATANKQSADIRAQGDAKAKEIFGTSYSQDPEFYAFYRSLLAYQRSFNKKDDVLVLRPDSEFFDYFNQIQMPRDTSSQ